MVAISSTIIHLQQHVLPRKTLALSSQTCAHHHVQLLLVLSQIEHAVSRRSVSRGKTCILTSFYQVASSLENRRVKGEQTLKGKRFCETQGLVYFLVKRSEQLTYDLHSYQYQLKHQRGIYRVAGRVNKATQLLNHRNRVKVEISRGQGCPGGQRGIGSNWTT